MKKSLMRLQKRKGSVTLQNKTSSTWERPSTWQSSQPLTSNNVLTKFWSWTLPRAMSTNLLTWFWSAVWWKGSISPSSAFWPRDSARLMKNIRNFSLRPSSTDTTTSSRNRPTRSETWLICLPISSTAKPWTGKYSKLSGSHLSLQRLLPECSSKYSSKTLPRTWALTT